MLSLKNFFSDSVKKLFREHLFRWFASKKNFYAIHRVGMGYIANYTQSIALGWAKSQIILNPSRWDGLNRKF